MAGEVNSASSTGSFDADNNNSRFHAINGLQIVGDFPPPEPVLRGDVNLDSEVNFLDIQPFVGILSTGEYQAEADFDEDCEVTFLDIQPFAFSLSE